MLALMAEREQTRTLLRAKLQKIIQKTTFGGIFFVLDRFDRILSSVIDSHLNDH